MTTYEKMIEVAVQVIQESKDWHPDKKRIEANNWADEMFYTDSELEKVICDIVIRILTKE